MLRAHGVIRQIDMFCQQGVEVSGLPHPCLAPGMLQHTPDNPLRPPAVFGDLMQIFVQRLQDIVQVCCRVGIRRGRVAPQEVPQFLDELQRQVGKIGHKIEGIADLVGNPGCQRAQRGQFLLYEQLILRGLQLP